MSQSETGINHLDTLGGFFFYFFFSTVVYKWDVTVEIDTSLTRTENENSSCSSGNGAPPGCQNFIFIDAGGL